MRGGAHCVAIALAGAVAIPTAVSGTGGRKRGGKGGGGGVLSRRETVRAGLELAMPRRSVGPPPNGTNGRPYCTANARAVVIGIVHWVQLCLLINSRNAAHKLYCTVLDRGVEALIGMGQSRCAMDAGLELSTPLVSRSLQGGIRTAPLQNGTARRSHPNIPGLLSCSIAVPAQSLPPSVGYPL